MAMPSDSLTCSNKSMQDMTYTAVGNLIKLLPTGTAFLFHFLNPMLTNYGECEPINRLLAGILIAVSAFACCFSTFTDSYTDIEGHLRYGIATKKGLWPSDSSLDLSKYKLRTGDFVHAFFSLIVFAVVALSNNNTVDCYYPDFKAGDSILPMILPPVIGAISSAVFVAFPNKRHGIGYPPSWSFIPSPSQSSGSKLLN